MVCNSKTLLIMRVKLLSSKIRSIVSDHLSDSVFCRNENNLTIDSICSWLDKK